jgi:hypothetical protein
VFRERAPAVREVNGRLDVTCAEPASIGLRTVRHLLQVRRVYIESGRKAVAPGTHPPTKFCQTGRAPGVVNPTHTVPAVKSYLLRSAHRSLNTRTGSW